VINLTEQAKKELRRLLSQKVDMPQARLRLMDRGKGILGLGIDTEASGDIIVEYEGTKVLICEPVLANNLQGVTIDVDDTPEGTELVLIEERM